MAAARMVGAAGGFSRCYLEEEADLILDGAAVTAEADTVAEDSAAVEAVLEVLAEG